MSQAYQLKQAWVGLRKKGGFVATVVTTMGITLGALLCILTLAYVMLGKPLPYPEQDKLYQVDSVFSNAKGKIQGIAYTYPGLIHLYDNQELFGVSALVYYGQDVLTSQSTQPTMNTTYVTPGWFKLLDAKMAMGRAFDETEAKNTNNPVAVMSFNTWQDEFGGDADILSQKINFSGTSFNIVGVLAESYVEPQLNEVGVKSNVFLPWDFNQASERQRESWGNISTSQRFVGKLTSNMNVEQVEQTLTILVHDTWTERVFDVAFFKGWSIKVQLLSFKTAILGDAEDTVMLLLAGVIGLVLVACANISNLFMSRTAEQQRQLAIHAAVGATKKQLFKTLFAETGLLMFVSVVFALVIANVGFYLLQHYLAERLPRVDELAINGLTLGAAVLIGLLLGLFFARLSASMINYKALNSTLQSSGKGTGVQVSHKVRRLLIISQVAIVTTLVFANISLLRDALKTIDAPLGFNTDNISTVELSISAPSFPPDEEMIPLVNELKRKLLEEPEVQSVSLAGSPVNGGNILAQVVDGPEERLVVETRRVDDQYFQMIEQPLIEGDYFSAADIKDKNDLIIVNHVYAEKLLADGIKALGSKIKMNEQVFTISGVVKGVKRPAATEIPMRAYIPTRLSASSMLVKFTDNQVMSRERVVSIIAQVNSQFSLFHMDSVNDRRAQLLFTQYVTAVTSAVLAMLTFFLAAVGLYGILSYGTQMRRFELGTRLAIGAKRKDLIAMIIKDNTAAVLIGIVVSLVVLLIAYIGFSEALANYVGVQMIGIFVVTLALISTMALFACYWPLRPFINYPAIHSLRGSD
ncbi:MAG: putative permease [Phenylobacterium sp.]|jgi:predicted permease